MIFLQVIEKVRASLLASCLQVNCRVAPTTLPLPDTKGMNSNAAEAASVRQGRRSGFF
jgi:hypothetical protein